MKGKRKERDLAWDASGNFGCVPLLNGGEVKASAAPGLEGSLVERIERALTREKKSPLPTKLCLRKGTKMPRLHLSAGMAGEVLGNKRLEGLHTTQSAPPPHTRPKS